MISIIIPTYNRVIETERAVKSVLNQSVKDFEILIADDGSTDTTSEVFSHYPDLRVKYIRVEHSGLPAVPRNAALRQASGEWVAFLDSDDEWLPNKLETQLKIINSFPDVGLVCSNSYINKGIQTPYSYYHDIKLPSKEWTFPDLLIQNIIITSSVLAKKSLLLNSGGFPEDNDFKVGEDYTLWLCISLEAKIIYIHDPLLIYTDIGNSVHKEQPLYKYWLGMEKIPDYLLKNFPPQKIHLYISQIKSYRSSCLQNLIICYSSSDENKLFFNTCLKLIINQPLEFINYKFVLKQFLQRFTKSITR
jgi:glycosyltransferase involved in cell wall biosynthesis